MGTSSHTHTHIWPWHYTAAASVPWPPEAKCFGVSFGFCPPRGSHQGRWSDVAFLGRDISLVSGKSRFGEILSFAQVEWWSWVCLRLFFTFFCGKSPLKATSWDDILENLWTTESGYTLKNCDWRCWCCSDKKLYNLDLVVNILWSNLFSIHTRFIIICTHEYHKHITNIS